MHCVRHQWLGLSAGCLVDTGCFLQSPTISSLEPSPSSTHVVPMVSEFAVLPLPHRKGSFTENTSLSFAIIEFGSSSFQISNSFSLVRERVCFSCSRFLSGNSLLARKKGRSRALWGAVRMSRCSPSMVLHPCEWHEWHCICKEGDREPLSTPCLHLHFIRHPVGWFACRPSSLTALSVTPT